MKTILLKRRNALGDVLLTTPIVKRLHDEGWGVYVQTIYPEVFDNNPHVMRVLNWRDPVMARSFDKVVNLDLVYEKDPKRHIIDAYSLRVFGDEDTEKKLYLFPRQDHRDRAFAIIQEIVPDPFVVVHMGVSWENRTWSFSNWINVVHALVALGFRVVIMGGNNDYGYNADKIHNLVGLVLPIQTVYALMKHAKLFIGTDSGLLHVAQAAEIPAIGIYTCAKAEYRATGAFPIVPDLDCYGCLHEEAPPVTHCDCRRGDFACLQDITPNKIIDKVKEIFVG